MEEKYLPIGTVCLLKGGSKRVMIIGFGIRPNENPDIMYDYLGCLFPEGVVSLEQNMVFNHDQIQSIIAKGFADDETAKFNEALKDAISKLNVKQAPSQVPQQPTVPETPVVEQPSPMAAPAETPAAAPAVEPIPTVEPVAQVAPQPIEQLDQPAPVAAPTAAPTPVAPETPAPAAPAAASTGDSVLPNIQPNIMPLGGTPTSDNNTN